MGTFELRNWWVLLPTFEHNKQCLSATTVLEYYNRDDIWYFTNSMLFELAATTTITFLLPLYFLKNIRVSLPGRAVFFRSTFSKSAPEKKLLGVIFWRVFLSRQLKLISILKSNNGQQTSAFFKINCHLQYLHLTCTALSHFLYYHQVYPNFIVAYYIEHHPLSSQYVCE